MNQVILWASVGQIRANIDGVPRGWKRPAPVEKGVTMPPAVFTLKEAAEYFRIDVARLRRISTGPRPKIASINEGNSRTYRLSALEADLEAHESPAPPPNPWGMSDATARRVRRAT